MSSGAPGDKTCGRQIEDSYCHLSTTFTTKMPSESVNRKPSESVNQQKRVVKLVKTASGKHAQKMFLLTSETCQLFQNKLGSISIPTSRGPRWCFGEGRTDSMGPNGLGVWLVIQIAGDHPSCMFRETIVYIYRMISCMRNLRYRSKEVHVSF